jgi:hypothetical protein
MKNAMKHSMNENVYRADRQGVAPPPPLQLGGLAKHNP